MITMITGGSKNGRSGFAEQLLDGCKNKIYLATMEPFGEDALRCIERHRELRAGKGFITAEIYRDIDKADLPRCDGMLLECISNLLANEMFSEMPSPDPVEKIIRGIKHLAEITEHLVIVTSQVGADGSEYEEGTKRYIRNMGRLNSRIAELSDNAAECVYGIPVPLKGDFFPC